MNKKENPTAKDGAADQIVCGNDLLMNAMLDKMVDLGASIKETGDLVRRIPGQAMTLKELEKRLDLLVRNVDDLGERLEKMRETVDRQIADTGKMQTGIGKIPDHISQLIAPIKALDDHFRLHEEKFARQEELHRELSEQQGLQVYKMKYITWAIMVGITLLMICLAVVMRRS